MRCGLKFDSVLTVDDLASVPNGASPGCVPDCNELVPLEELERRAILHAMRETGGDKLAAAHHLGIGKTTLYRRIKEYDEALRSVDKGSREEQ